MKYFQIIVATICTLCFSLNISAQDVRPIDNTEDDGRVYNSKANLLKQVKSNIERKQGRNPEDETVTTPDERRSADIKDTPTKNTSRKVILSKEDN